jgi:hypothetical protein
LALDAGFKEFADTALYLLFVVVTSEGDATLLLELACVLVSFLTIVLGLD